MAAPGDEPVRDGSAIDREIRLNEAWHEADEMAREQVEKQGVAGAASESAIETWRNLYAYDTAPDTSQHEILRAEGIDLPPADDLDDAAVTAKLWEIIHALAARNTFLHHTDHLSDRGLYTHLVEECFHEITKDIPSGTGWIHGIDILGSYGEEEIELHHRFYADDETRAQWLEKFPNDKLPPKEQPPYDRDRHLPKSPFG